VTARLDVALPSEIFEAKVNIPLIHQVVVAQQAAARQGTHSTKTRGEVRGGGRKPYRQKGTGRARQGSVRAPQFAGGGIVHGPKPRSYAQKTPKKMKAAALRGALSDRAQHGRIFVVGKLVDGDTPKTKTALTALNEVLAGADFRIKRTLVVLDRADEVTWKSLRNEPSVHLLVADQLNTYDVLCSDVVVFTQTGYAEFLTHAGQAEAAAAVAEAKEIPAPKPKKAAPKKETTAAEDKPARKPRASASKAKSSTAEAAEAKAEAASAKAEAAAAKAEAADAKAEAAEAKSETAETETAETETAETEAEPAGEKKPAAKKPSTRKPTAKKPTAKKEGDDE
jgi:large subunit ribosomal protein L4